MKLPLLLTLAASAPFTVSAAMLERFVYNGHTYEIYSDARSWSAAQTDAQSRTVGGASGYLWNVNSSAENTYVFTKIQQYQASFTATAADGGGARYLWLGASDAAGEGVWRWTDGNANFWNGQGAAGLNNGAAVGGLYNNWGGNATYGFAVEPDDYLANQDAAGIALDGWGMPNGVAGEWNDINAANAMPYVVEYNAVAIPEPSAYAGVFAAGAFALALRRRRVRA